MISKVECSILECDNCKEIYEAGFSGFSIFADDSSVLEYASDDDWEVHHDSGKHYCDKCYHYNDNDEFILNTERNKNP